MQMGIVAGGIGHIRSQNVAGAARSGHGDGHAVEGYAVRTPFDGLEKGGGQAEVLSQQLFHRHAVLLLRDSVGQYPHFANPPCGVA